ncbi:MAG: hypothetical protein KGL39_30535, partial [Patescibacteria group bacterium]|nr:hypothetical protein [Patescibacteria group bacterium]
VGRPFCVNAVQCARDAEEIVKLAKDSVRTGVFSDAWQALQEVMHLYCGYCIFRNEQAWLKVIGGTGDYVWRPLRKE